MIWAVINNILSSICKIFYKKAVSLATLPPLLFSRFGEAIGFVLALVMIVVFGFETSVLSWAVVIGITVLIVINLASSACNQKLYRIEKLSNIIPYQNLKSVFSIIAGFLIFKDASLFSFVIAVISFLVILGFSLDFKNLKLPKSIGLLLLIQTFGAVDTLLTGRFLISLSDLQYFISYELIVIIILTIVVLIRTYFKNLKGINKSFYGFRLGDGLLGNISWIIYLFVVGNLGVVMSVLLSFMGTGISMLFSRLFLKEKPEKKTIIMCLIVTTLVVIGFTLG